MDDLAWRGSDLAGPSWCLVVSEGTARSDEADLHEALETRKQSELAEMEGDAWMGVREVWSRILFLTGSDGDLRVLAPRRQHGFSSSAGRLLMGLSGQWSGVQSVEVCCGYCADTSGLCCLPRQRPGEGELKVASRRAFSGCTGPAQVLFPALTPGSSCVCVYRTVSITCSQTPPLTHLHVKSVVLKVGF